MRSASSCDSLNSDCFSIYISDSCLKVFIGRVIVCCAFTESIIYQEKINMSVKTVKIYPELIDTILLQPEAQNWATSEFNTKPFELVDLDCNSYEYRAIAARASCLSIKRIQRVENPFLLAEYLLKKQKAHMSASDVFHGTRITNVELICKRNFNWRLAGTARGHKFGRGVSFSPDAYYAHHYSKSIPKVMFSCKIVQRNSTFGDCFMRIPPEPYDTSSNLKGSVLVKYEDNDFYPEYVIHF